MVPNGRKLVGTMDISNMIRRLQLLERKRHFVGFGELAHVFSISFLWFVLDSRHFPGEPIFFLRVALQGILVYHQDQTQKYHKIQEICESQELARTSGEGQKVLNKKRKEKRKRGEEKKKKRQVLPSNAGPSTRRAWHYHQATPNTQGKFWKYIMKTLSSRTYLYKVDRALLNMNSRIFFRRMAAVLTVKTQRKCISSHLKNGNPIKPTRLRSKRVSLPRFSLTS